MNYNTKGSWIGAGLALLLAVAVTLIVELRGLISIIFCCFSLGLGGVIGSIVSQKTKASQNIKSILIFIICFVVLIALGLGFLKCCFLESEKNKSNDKLDEIMNKNPNYWTEEEKAYVDEVFDAIDVHNRNNNKN